MKDFLDKIINPNYKKFYGIYKKLPGILAITIAVLYFIWSIIDVAVFSYEYTDRFGNVEGEYGVMGLHSWFFALLIWWIIGAINAFFTWFFSVLIVSTKVTIADSVIEINNKLSRINTSTNNLPHTEKTTATEQPKPASQPTVTQPNKAEQPKQEQYKIVTKEDGPKTKEDLILEKWRDQGVITEEEYQKLIAK